MIVSTDYWEFFGNNVTGWSIGIGLFSMGLIISSIASCAKRSMCCSSKVVTSSNPRMSIDNPAYSIETTERGDIRPKKGAAGGGTRHPPGVTKSSNDDNQSVLYENEGTPVYENDQDEQEDYEEASSGVLPKHLKDKQIGKFPKYQNKTTPNPKGKAQAAAMVTEADDDDDDYEPVDAPLSASTANLTVCKDGETEYVDMTKDNDNDPRDYENCPKELKKLKTETV